MKKTFPTFGIEKGMKKKHSRISGTGIRRLSLPGTDGNGNSRSPLVSRELKAYDVLLCRKGTRSGKAAKFHQETIIIRWVVVFVSVSVVVAVSFIRDHQVVVYTDGKFINMITFTIKLAKLDEVVDKYML